MEPQEIEERQFGTTLRGYDRQEVEDFAKEVAEQVRRLQDDLTAAQSALEAAKSAPPPAPPPPSPAQDPAAQPRKADAYKQLGEETARILISAEQAANEIREHAKREAAEVLADARRDAGRIARQAREGKQQAEADLRELLGTRAVLAGQLEDVRRRLAEAVARLQAPLEQPASAPVQQDLPDVLPSLSGDSPRNGAAVTGPRSIAPGARPRDTGLQVPEPNEELGAKPAANGVDKTAIQEASGGGKSPPGHRPKAQPKDEPAVAAAAHESAETGREAVQSKAPSRREPPATAEVAAPEAAQPPSRIPSRAEDPAVPPSDQKRHLTNPGESPSLAPPVPPKDPAPASRQGRAKPEMAVAPSNGSGRKQASSRDAVDLLLEEIREDSKGIPSSGIAGQSSSTVGAPPSPSSPPAEPATVPGQPADAAERINPAHSLSRAGTVNAPGATGSVKEKEDAFFGKRAEALGDSPYEAARKLKRLLQEDHNDLLHRLRSQRGRGSVEQNMAPEKEQLDRFTGALRQVLENAFAKGRQVGGATGQGDPGETLFSLVARQVVLPLRSDLCRVVENGLAAQDTPTSISERASDVFRIWKGVRTELLGEGLVYAAFHQGLLDAWKDKQGAKRWIFSSEEQECPKGVCQANVSEGPVPVGSHFPSGHVSPPAHGGCTCGLQPS